VFLFLFVACLSNKSPSQASLHNMSGTYYQWLSRVLLQLLVFSMQLLDFTFSSSLLIQRVFRCRKRYEKPLSGCYSSEHKTEDNESSGIVMLLFIYVITLV